MRILLLPPDERPVSTTLPRMVGACAGVDVVLPPPHLLPAFRRPAECDALATWLVDEAPAADAVIVSLDLLGHGGLVPSRLTDCPATDVVTRLGALRTLPIRAGTPLYAAMVVTRVPDLDDATEEPDYWSRHGRAIHALSARLSERPASPASGPEGDSADDPVRAGIPADVVGDWLNRRLRNHVANLAALELVSDGTVDLLALTADDTAPLGLPAVERSWLEGWSARLRMAGRVFHYPGADEVPSILVVRLAARGYRPRVAIHAADLPGLARVAPYEDQPILDTVTAQVNVAGGVVVEDNSQADLILAVHTPTGGSGDWALSPPDPETLKAGVAPRLAEDITGMITAGHQVALADCAWPNGGDPTLVAALGAHGALSRLAGYAGWNTAGNSIGSALAQAFSRLADFGTDSAHRAEAHERLLCHRLLEDVGYQAGLRAGIAALAHDQPDAAAAVLERRLAEEISRYGDLSQQWRVRPGSVRLPWRRAFECDFDLERTGA
ncbi:DUF4127 family protein [Phytoactinopolyspora alkaliphila]|uniref:DUF4127 family protein n=1 Tax=Phytoactinopolyspora alkaliphila TaxID=1783498 RepID=A0A6N9YJ03_9ACTN|nr:DUF4127 family protein [Phytoactinopolyspora alkaliphila]NED94900.1 DUF4127 family protein [Phytoactinopolyspora alkaliphila]